MPFAHNPTDDHSGPIDAGSPIDGSPAAHARLRALFDAHFDFVGRVARNLGLSAADSDDVAQQVFGVVHRRLGDILPGHERAFLAQTVVRIAANHRRARRREVAWEFAPEMADAGLSPEELSDQRRALEALDRLLSAMELDLRSVFVLYEIEGLTMSEIASAMSLPQGTVASRLRRAREDFQKHLRRMRGPVREGTKT